MRITQHATRNTQHATRNPSSIVYRPSSIVPLLRRIPVSDEAAPLTGRALFDEIGASLAPQGVQTGAMFGMPCLKTGGKAFAGFYQEAMVFKLPPDGVATALALPG